MKSRIGLKVLRLPLETSGTPAVRIVRSSGPAEGYSIRTDANGVTIKGNDGRGVSVRQSGIFFARCEFSRQKAELSGPLNVTTAPKYPLRGHQLGYRPKTNSYDGWTVAHVGAVHPRPRRLRQNAIELIPPRSDDDDDSPHFPLPADAR